MPPHDYKLPGQTTNGYPVHLDSNFVIRESEVESPLSPEVLGENQLTHEGRQAKTFALKCEFLHGGQMRGATSTPPRFVERYERPVANQWMLLHHFALRLRGRRLAPRLDHSLLFAMLLSPMLVA
jgi:hypothetical protein